MYVPGRVVQMIKVRSGKLCGCCWSRRTFEPMWAHKEDFQQLLVTHRMALDHFPDYLLFKMRDLSDQQLADMAGGPSLSRGWRVPRAREGLPVEVRGELLVLDCSYEAGRGQEEEGEGAGEGGDGSRIAVQPAPSAQPSAVLRVELGNEQHFSDV